MLVTNEANNHLQQQQETSLHKFARDVNHKLATFAATLGQLEARIDYLKLVGNIATQLDCIGNEIRMVSSLSDRRFMTNDDEEDDTSEGRSLQTAVDEHKSVLDKLKSFEQEVDGLREETQRASSGSSGGGGAAAAGQAVPVYLSEKLVQVAEAVRHALSRELDRRSSLLEAKQVEDQRLMRIKSLNRNLEILHTILTSNLKNGQISLFFILFYF